MAAQRPAHALLLPWMTLVPIVVPVLVFVSAFALSACGSDDGPSVVPLDGAVPGQVDPRLTQMAALHNAVRAGATPAPSPALPDMVWADDLAAAAQAYANTCNFNHDRNRGSVGENLAVNAPAGWQDAAGVVDGWAEEVEDYDYENNSCSGVCGHYTQIVWRESVEVGCGVATCNGITGFTGDQGEIWVCRYRAPGNFNGRRPY